MLYPTIFLISLSILTYEIIFMRIFSITQWHHFAYLVMSIALLGFGASGSFISLFQNRLKKAFSIYYFVFAYLFSLSLPLGFWMSQKIPFDPFLIVWDKRQYLYLLAYYLILFIPFFFGATCIGLAFSKYPGKISQIYFYNLLGSGAGAFTSVWLLYLLHPLRILYVISGSALLAAAFSFPLKGEGKKEREITLPWLHTSLLPVLIVLLLLGTTGLLYTVPLRLRISQYKGLSIALNLPHAEIVQETHGPLGLIDVVKSPAIRYAPGLSLKYTQAPPPQLGLYIDASEAGAMTHFKEDLSDLQYLDYISSALAYHVRSPDKVLILGAGGGTDVLTALYHQSGQIHAVELNRQIVDLVNGPFKDFTRGIYTLPQVQVKIAEARSYVESTSDAYDLIQVTLLDAFSASSAGVYALNESYIYTVEAFKKYLERLTPNGILSITRWIKLPPRDNLKVFATAVQALEEIGTPEIPRHLILIRSWATATLLVSLLPFSGEEIARVKEFCRTRLFDTVYFPGITEADDNKYNQLPSPHHYHGVQKILFGDRQKFYQDYLFNIKPATDNQPYFFHFFKWKALPTLIASMGREWIPFIEWGYIILIAALIQSIPVSLILIILPLLRLPTSSTWGIYKLRVFIYFGCLGLGFLFLEMVYIQKFILFLANPIYAISVIIFSFLFFSGLGSFYSKKFSRPSLPILAMVGISLVYFLTLKFIFQYFMAYGSGVRIAITILLVAPLAFFMGMPFPIGLSKVSLKAPELIPWAWGINGYASVISSILATTLAISWGFHVVIGLALLLYLIALKMI
ncbi:MAG TPA: hypothetical protein VNM22_03720 [Candidatus Limnocylindrales bacterium]|nr:hypothetical protein [Candidatus Limnocylindrales bacterium]